MNLLARVQVMNQKNSDFTQLFIFMEIPLLRHIPKGFVTVAFYRNKIIVLHEHSSRGRILETGILSLGHSIFS